MSITFTCLLIASPHFPNLHFHLVPWKGVKGHTWASHLPLNGIDLEILYPFSFYQKPQAIYTNYLPSAFSLLYFFPIERTLFYTPSQSTSFATTTIYHYHTYVHFIYFIQTHALPLLPLWYNDLWWKSESTLFFSPCAGTQLNLSDFVSEKETSVHFVLVYQTNRRQ